MFQVQLRLVLISAMFFLSCCDRSADKKTSGPSPLATLRELMRLHDLEGRQPEDRPAATRKKQVDQKALAALFLDFERQDGFLADLYVGFIVGAVARHQAHLKVRTIGNRADVTAGNVRVRLRWSGERWQIAIAESIPDEIKQRAAQLKARHKL
ncbi:MAG: hypothetical protein QNJ97_06235 [Myxococcota bacterium]|nr:hypothetical protein [Myxococcota bacterium]